MKQPPKRRNTMNSRDAAYEQEMQLILEATAAEAAATAAEATKETTGKESLVASPPTMNGHGPDAPREGDAVPEPEPDISGARRKRKRTDDERCAAAVCALQEYTLDDGHALIAVVQRNAPGPRLSCRTEPMSRMSHRMLPLR